MASAQLKRPEVIYPDSDGKPMADNTLQWEWIDTIKGGLDALFRDDPNVFVAADLLWYPVEGNNKVSAAPDTLVAFGRPKGYRGSYKQWEEEGIAPQVVFEILSPGNRVEEMTRKFRFYEKYGVEEYYIYDPDEVRLSGWLRSDGGLEEIPDVEGWVSPRLGIRFELGEELRLIGPDGRPFVSYVELARQRDEMERRSEEAERRGEEDRRRAERLAARLRELGEDVG
jgi:Uma2 family endonuclease